MYLMRMAACCFEEIADSTVLSHVHHAKNAVPFQTMKLPDANHTTLAEIPGDPYSKKSPLPSICTFPSLAAYPKDTSYRVLGQSRIHP